MAARTVTRLSSTLSDAICMSLDKEMARQRKAAEAARKAADKRLAAAATRLQASARGRAARSMLPRLVQEKRLAMARVGLPAGWSPRIWGKGKLAGRIFFVAEIDGQKRSVWTLPAGVADAAASDSSAP